jgi:chitin-binding protein
MVTTAGVRYYINATDGTNFSTHPATNPTTSPHTITVTTMNTPPTAATLNNPSDITQNSMKLTWTESTEADFARYEIYQSTNSGTLGTKIYTIADRSITNYTVTELSADTTYYFTIRAVDTAGLFADSVQVSGRTTPSSQADEAESTPPWIWWVVGGVVTISVALTVVILALRQRKK